MPREGNTSVWEPFVMWTNGSTTSTKRRQRTSLIRDPKTGSLTHIVNGADFLQADGTHWGTGFTLIQPLQGSDFQDQIVV